MFSFTGRTSGIVTSNQLNLPTVIESFSVVNKTTGEITFNVYKIAVGGGVYCISPNNLSLSQSQMYEGTRPVVMLATEQVRVHATGAVDFDFTINNLDR